MNIKITIYWEYNLNVIRETKQKLFKPHKKLYFITIKFFHTYAHSITQTYTRM